MDQSSLSAIERLNWLTILLGTVVLRDFVLGDALVRLVLGMFIAIGIICNLLIDIFYGLITYLSRSKKAV